MTAGIFARGHVCRAASVISPAPFALLRNTDQRTGILRTRHRSQTRRHVGSVASVRPRARFALIRKTRQRARNSRTRSANLGRAVTLVAPLRLSLRHTSRSDGRRTNGREMSARGAVFRRARPRRRCRVGNFTGARRAQTERGPMSATTSARAAPPSGAPPRWQCGPRLFSPRRTARSYRRHTNEREASARAAPLPGAPPRAQDRFGYLSPAHCAPRRKSHQ